MYYFYEYQKEVPVSGSAAYLLSCFGFPFLMAYAAVSDLLTMRISNRVTSLVLFTFVLYALADGMMLTELALHIAAGCLVLAAAFVMFARGWIGGGDAKLAAGATLWLGIEYVAEYLIAASVFGGVLTLVILFARAYPLPMATLRLPFAVNLHDSRTGIPYGIALATAALTVLPHAMG